MAEIICSHCKNPIYDDDALSCHFCGESLGRVSNSGLGKMQGPASKWFVITLIVLVLGAFLMLMWR